MGRDAVLVDITPPVQGMPGGEISRAVLVARRRDRQVKELFFARTNGSCSVSVCRIRDAADLTSLSRQDVDILFWGRVYQQPQAVEA